MVIENLLLVLQEVNLYFRDTDSDFMEIYSYIFKQ